MKDIEIARKYLEEDNLAIAVVKNGELIYKDLALKNIRVFEMWYIMYSI